MAFVPMGLESGFNLVGVRLLQSIRVFHIMILMIAYKLSLGSGWIKHCFVLKRVNTVAFRVSLGSVIQHEPQLMFGLTGKGKPEILLELPDKRIHFAML